MALSKKVNRELDAKVMINYLQDIKQLLALQVKFESEKIKAMKEIRDAIKERK
jgi:hypothetical protein